MSSIEDTFSGLLGGDSGADDAMERGDAMTAEQQAMLRRAKTMYETLFAEGSRQANIYRQSYLPVERKAALMARGGVKADYRGITNLGGQASREVGRQIDIARGSAIRGLTRRGVNVGSGAHRSLRASMALGEAGAKAGAFTRANMEEQRLRREERRYADETTFKRRAQIAGMGRTVNAAARSSWAGAAGGLTSGATATGNAADQQYGLAEQLGEASGGGIGDIINAGIRIYGASQGMPA